MLNPVHYNRPVSGFTLSQKLLKGLEGACVLLSAAAAIIGSAAFFLTAIDGQAINLFGNSYEVPLVYEGAPSKETNNGLTITIAASEGLSGALITLVVETSFTIALFMALKALLASLRMYPTALRIAQCMRRFAIVTLAWPVASFLTHILNGWIAGASSGVYLWNIEINFPLFSTGIALAIGSMAAQRLATAEQELEAVI
ncbi:hypothetical protein ACW9IO_21335 [Pseudomonas azotoformans]|jgi:hypothetical protein|uniref:DUF2975 domain-containing protein n=1 Tax=Pseudomonas reactans TaxID=117680 RepID=A0A7Y8KJ47_9PSED|nr:MULTISPECIES: hypothetical protein [Pseudomonas]ASV39133.1 hypothetical protein CI807_23980 [Pseudomonas sp. NS1(2017)]NWE90594.1 hypothetical protein [Pseudomonas reactans]